MKDAVMMQNKQDLAARGSRDSLPAVNGRMKFAAPNGEMENTARGCKIFDARPIADELSLDREGFRLIKHDSEVTKHGDADRLLGQTQAFLDDLAPVIKEQLRASWVVPSTGSKTGVIVRSSTKIGPDDAFYHTQNRGHVELPFPGVHLDYTPEAAVNLARAENYRRGQPDRSYTRLIIIQAWQAISQPPQDRPLALMDASTLEANDTIVAGPNPDPNDLSGDVLQARLVVYNPLQRFYFFPNTNNGEVILFKGYDSVNSLTPPHASFLDTSLGSTTRSRESIEGRFFVYYS